MPQILARLVTVAVIGVAALECGPAAAADPTGTWLTEDGRARVRTELCGSDHGHLCGYVVWRNPKDDKAQGPLDKANPDPRRQARPLLGHQMILGLKPDSDGRYAGRIYNGDNGKSYDVSIWSEKPSELSVRGCLLTVLCGTQTWTRVTGVEPGQLQAATDAPGGPRSDPEWAAPGTKAKGSDGRAAPPR